MRSATVHRLAAVAYALALALIAFWPTPVDQGLSIFGGHPVLYEITEFTANIVLFVPLGWFGVALLPRLSWTQVAAAGCAVSVIVETGQWLLRPERFATPGDVVANTAGATLGAFAASRIVRRQTVAATHS